MADGLNGQSEKGRMKGVVMNLEGSRKQARVQVNFSRSGSKWLMVSMANLQSAGCIGVIE